MNKKWLLLLAQLFVLPLAYATTPLIFSLPTSAPYAWADNAGEMHGIYPDIVRALARQSRLTIAMQAPAATRVGQKLVEKNNTYVLMFNHEYTAERFDLAAVIFKSEEVVQIQANKHIESKQALKTLKIGRLRGGCMELSKDPSVAWNFYELNSAEQGVKMLTHQRIDAFCGTAEIIDFAAIKSEESHNLANTQRFVLSSKPVWLMFPLGIDTHTKQSLLTALNALRESGELAQIFKKYLGESYNISPRATENAALSN